MLDARLSRMGVPLLTLSNSRAYAWSSELEGWACVADESFALSQYMPMLSLAGQGERRSRAGLQLAWCMCGRQQARRAGQADGAVQPAVLPCPPAVAQTSR